MERYSLIGVDGNAFSIISYVMGAMRESGYSKDEIESYRVEAMSSNYSYLMSVSAKMIDKINGDKC